MKKVLILAYDFPPYVSVGGLRPHSWYQYFYEFGVYPIVVTRQWGNKYGNYLDYIAPSESKETIIEETDAGTIIRTAYKPNLANRLVLKHGLKKYKYLRKLITAFFEIIQFIMLIGPKIGIYKGAKKYLAENKVDLIIATGEPFILFKYASKLSSKFKTPWIADYRDPWTQNNKRSQNILQLKWNSFFEKRFTKNASLIMTVSEFCEKQIETNVKNKEFYILMNGYDPYAINKVKHVKQNDQKLSFAFVGTVYEYHPIDSILNQFNLFIVSNPEAKIQLNFYGINVQENIEQLIDSKYIQLRDVVKIYPKMPNVELLKKLASNNIMLLVNYYSILGTKIFDYLALKRQIVLCYSNDKEAEELRRLHYPTNEIDGISTHLQADLINETESGVVVRDAEHLQETLNELYIDFEKDKLIKCNSIGTDKYSRKGQIKVLSEKIIQQDFK